MARVTLPPQVQAFLGTLPPAERLQTVAYFEHSTTTTISSQSGMPAPEILAQYQAIWPEAITFFAGEMQLQGQHRRSIEAQVFPGQIVIAKRGQIFAVCLALVALAVGVYLVHIGQTGPGLAVFGLMGAGFITQFLKTTFSKKKEGTSPE